MSPNDTAPTIAQARQILLTFEQAGLRRDQVQALLGGHLSVVLKMTKEHRLPNLEKFSEILDVFDSKPIKVATLELTGKQSDVEKLIERVRKLGSNVDRRVLESIADSPPPKEILKGRYDVMCVTPALLGFPTSSLREGVLAGKFAQEIMRNRTQYKRLVFFSNEAIMRFCLEGKTDFGNGYAKLVTNLFVYDEVELKFMITVSDDRLFYKTRRVGFSSSAIWSDTEICFLRPAE